MLAAGAHAGNYLGRFVVVVDEDIDPTNSFDVIWAMATRCDPVEDIDFIRRAWSGALDPRKRKGDVHNTRAIVDACRPYEWLKEFPPVAEFEPRAQGQDAGEMGPSPARQGAVTEATTPPAAASRPPH